VLSDRINITDVLSKTEDGSHTAGGFNVAEKDK
jgi:hypothetical protein